MVTNVGFDFIRFQAKSKAYNMLTGIGPMTKIFPRKTP